MREAVRAQGILRTVEGALPRLHITPWLIIHAARHTVANDLEVASRKVGSKRVAYRVHLDRVLGADSDHQLAHGAGREVRPRSDRRAVMALAGLRDSCRRVASHRLAGGPSGRKNVAADGKACSGMVGRTTDVRPV